MGGGDWQEMHLADLLVTGRMVGETIVEENGSKKGLDSGSELIRRVVYWGWYDLWEGNTEEEPCPCEGGVG